MSEHDCDRSKIHGDLLQDFAGADSSERMSVLIELATPPPQVRMGDRGWGKGSHRPLEIDAPDDASVRSRMDEMVHRLADILGTEPVRLDMAEACVADVTPDQLRRISRLSQVDKIRPNRTHRSG